MRIAIFIDWFYPAFKAGGPIKSVFNIIQNLKDSHDFLVISSNEDLNGEKIDVEPNVIIEKDGYRVIYLDRAARNRKRYRSLLQSFHAETIYINSIFSYPYAILPLMAFARESSYKCIVAPRGMLSKGALSLKPLKKKIFLRFLRSTRLVKKVHWHASTKIEAEEIKSALNINRNIHIAKNIASAIVEEPKPIAKKSGKASFCFISRISEKKNLLFFLNLIQAMDHRSKIQVDIFGPIDDEDYWETCKKVEGFGLNIRYLGALNPQEISSTLEKYHFFVLPSLNENYGHVIAEAINVGRPVLISDQTPWLNLEEAGVGYSIPLADQDEWLKKLNEIVEMNNEPYQKYLGNCLAYSKAHIVSEAVIEQNRSLFEANEN